MSFAGAYEFTLAHERGWWPGGASDPNPTLDGVTQRTYNAYRTRRNLPGRSVREMNPSERTDIYHEYWDDCDADLLPRRSAAAHFAFAFNAGPGPAMRVLQRALGVKDDGKLGPITRAAILDALDNDLLPRLLLEQLGHYRAICLGNATLRPNLLGWIGRLVGAWHYRPTTAPQGGTPT